MNSFNNLNSKGVKSTLLLPIIAVKESKFINMWESWYILLDRTEFSFDKISSIFFDTIDEVESEGYI